MEDTDVDVVVGEEVKLDKNGNPLVRDELGRFPAGVAQPSGWKKGQSGNPKGRPKGTSWVATLEKIMEEEGASINKEMFLRKMLQRAYSDPKDKVAGKFISDLIPKPKQQIEIGTPAVFELYDLSKEKGDVPELEEGGDDDGTDEIIEED